MTVDLGAQPAAAVTDPPRPRVGDGGDVALGGPSASVAGRHTESVHAVPPPPAPATVVAVLVVADGEAYLPRTLAALAAQTRRPDRLVVADRSSADGSPALLTPDALPQALRELPCERHGLARRTRPGAAVTAVLDDLDDAAWLWIVPDDCAPAPDALDRLLAVVETGPSIAVAGCAHVDWDDDQRILDVGVATTRGGARVTVVDRGEVDQGQHDARSDVLAVPLAGMLVRAGVWRTLGGPDPALAGARDDLDLGRRAHLAGYRVVVVPRAVAAHARSWRTGRRPGPRSWWLADRHDAVHQRLVAAPLLAVLPLLTLAVLAAPVRALVQVVRRRPLRARDEVAAVALVLLRPDRLVAARWRARRVRTVPRRTLRRLYAPRAQLVRNRWDALAAWVVPVPVEEAEAAEHAARRAERGLADDPDLGLGDTAGPALRVPVETGPSDEAAEPFVLPAPTRRARRLRFAATGLLPVLVVTAAAGAAGLRRLLGTGGAVVGPDLVAPPGSLHRLWQLATSSWRPTGLGAAGTADPLTALLAVLAVPFGGAPGRAVDALLLGALPAAAVSAWWAAGRLTRSRAVRGWAAACWAAAPPLLAAVSAGRLGEVVAHVVLPLAALAAVRAVGSPSRRPSLPAACAGGLLLTAVLAGGPSLAVAAVVAVGVLALVAQVRPAGSRLRAAVSLVPLAGVPGVLLLPWWTAVAGAPRLLLAGPVTPGGGSAPAAHPSPWHALGLATGPDAASGAVPGAVAAALRLLAPSAPVSAATVTAGLAVLLLGPALAAAAAAPVRPGAARVAAVAWLVSFAGLTTATLASRSVVGAAGIGGEAAGVLGGPAGPGLSLFVLGVLAAAVAALHRGRRALRPPRGVRVPVPARLGRGAVVAALGAVLVAAPVAVLGGWAWQGLAPAGSVAAAGAPAVRRAPADVLPAVAAAEAEGEAGARTLVLRVAAGEVRWSLERAGGPRLGDDSAVLAAHRLDGPPPAPAESALLAPAVADLLGDGGADARSRLAEVGIGSVLLVPPVADDVALALDASPGLIRTATVRGAVLWRVELPAQPGAPTRAARARIVDERGLTTTALPSDGEEVDVDVPASAGKRFVVLTDRADGGWSATIDGAPLTSLTTSGWAQCFELPRHAGRLRIVHRASGDGLVPPLQAAVAALAVLGLVPLPRVRRRLAPPAPPQPSRPVPRAALAGPGADELPPAPRVFDETHPEDGDLDAVPTPADATPADATPAADAAEPDAAEPDAAEPDAAEPAPADAEATPEPVAGPEPEGPEAEAEDPAAAPDPDPEPDLEATLLIGRTPAADEPADGERAGDEPTSDPKETA